MMLGLGVRCGTGERCRYRQNWLVITSYCTLIGLAYSSALPSLHQFVTSSAYPEDDDVQPGLGLSETWYSWIVSIQSIGELAGAIAISLLLRWFYTKYLMLISLAVCGGGGVLYGVGKYGWMLLIGRFLMGSCQGAVTVILRTYIGETSSTIIASLPPEQREKSTLKYTAFFVTFTVCTLSVLAGPGVAAVVAQIPSIDQFRWPGYFMLVHAMVLAVTTLLGFREKNEDIRREGGSIKLRGIPIPFYTIACLIGAFFVINWYFAVFETLLNPVLGDNFGFDVEFNSYAFIGTLVFFSCGPIILYTLQRLYVDNRITCLLGLVVALFGSLISTDWQSLRGDPCNQFSEIAVESPFNSTFDTNYSSNVFYDFRSNTSGSGESPLVTVWCDTQPGSYYCTATRLGINLEQCEDDVMSNINASCVCEAFSDAPYHCFWNPHSRVTGKVCKRCSRLCRSRDRSLYLAQFLVGMTLVSLTIPLGRITVTLITSDALAGGSQSLIMGVLVAVGAMGRFTGPLWSNAAYLAANHHVYIVMNILTVSMMLVIVPYLLLYRTMKPAQQAQLLSTVDSVDAIELSGMTNNHLEEQNDTDGLMLKHSTYVGDIRTSDSSSDSVSELDQGVSEEREGGGGDRVQGSGKRVDSERALLLGDVELGEDELEEDQL